MKLTAVLHHHREIAFHFRGIPLDPTPHRDVIGVQAPLGKEFLHVTGRQGEAQVPADCQEYHLRLKLTPLEQTGNRWDEDHPSILAARLHKVATLPFDSLVGGYDRLDISIKFDVHFKTDSEIFVCSGSAAR